jgi:uncharacterized protein
MDHAKYQNIAAFMEDCLKGDINNLLHSYRVLNYALQILASEPEACAEVVIIAALLHDIGRMEKKPGRKEKAFHAKAGSEKSRAFLLENGYTEETAGQVAGCILTHSLNAETPPQTLEAQIVFDADKLDLSGAVGATRAIAAAALTGEPLYVLDEAGLPLSGKKKEGPSVLRDHKQRLKELPQIFYTAKAQKIAAKQQEAMDSYFENLRREINKNHKNGRRALEKYCSAE